MRTTAWMHVIPLLLIAAPALAQVAPRFPDDNVWNHPVQSLPVHPNSSQWIRSWFPPGRGFALNPKPTCGLPVNLTGPPTRRMRFRWNPPGMYPYAPLLPFESCSPDSHWVGWDTADNRLFEIYGLHWALSDTAESGGEWDLASNSLRPVMGGPADESGLPIAPGLLYWQELHDGVVPHALRFALSWASVADSAVWPAWTFSRRKPLAGAIPLGMRLRLRGDYPMPPSASPECRAFLQALETYGAILADRAGDTNVMSVGQFSLLAVPDSRWGTVLQEISQVTVGIASHLEFVDESGLILDPASGACRNAPLVKPRPRPLSR